MAKIVLDLNKFKASGIYTIEFDASERIVTSSTTLRLVVGFSRKGPFNTVVFLKDAATAKKIFGEIDTWLESKGSFFHRTLESCLRVAPVFALNLLPLNNCPINEGGDSVEYTSYSLSAAEPNGKTVKSLFSSFFNKERFWTLDTEYLQATANTNLENKDRLFNIVNTSQNPVSIFVRKSVNANQFNIPAEEYYNNKNIPAFVKPDDFISEYFVDLVIIRGDWTDYSKLSKDPFYSKYFDIRGLRTSKINEFLSLDTITLLGSFTGTIIPNFIDNLGRNQSLDVVVNANSNITGIFLNLNESMLLDYENSKYKVDLVGHSLIDSTQDTVNFLSYNTPIKSELKFQSSNSNLGNEIVLQEYSNVSDSPYIRSFPYGGTSGKFGNILVIPKPIPSDTVFTQEQWEFLLDSLNTNSLVRTHGTDTIQNSLVPNDFVKVENVINTGSELLVQVSNPLKTDYLDYIEESVAVQIPVTSNVIQISEPSQFSPSTGDVILIEFPGFAKYFEIQSVTNPALGISEITVKTNPTSGGPLFLNKWCSTGFVTEDFASIVQPSQIKVTLFEATNSQSLDLIPNVDIFPGSRFGIILNPSATMTSVEGLGPISGYNSWNEVTIVNETTPSITYTGPYYLKSYNFDWTDPSFREVLIENASGQNPFNIDGGSLLDIVKVTLPGGQEFRGIISDVSLNPTSTNLEQTNLVKYAYFESYPGSDLSKKIFQNLVISGDKIKFTSVNYNYLLAEKSHSQAKDSYSRIAYGLFGTKISQFDDADLSKDSETTFVDLNLTYNGDSVYNLGAPNTVYVSVQSSLVKNISETLVIEEPGIYDGGKKFQLSSANASKLEIGDYVVSAGNPLLLRIVGKLKKVNPLSGTITYEYTTREPVRTEIRNGKTYITKFIPFNKFMDFIQLTGLSGFRITDYHLPNGTEEQIEKIYGVLEKTNLSKVLSDRNVIQFRYVVDTFEGGLAPNMGAKSILSRLAKKKLQCMAILNAPSIKQFTESTDPRFTDAPDASSGNPKPLLNTSYIKDGGNLTLGPSFRFTLPDEENGAKFCGIFSPNLIIFENGKQKSIPPAADVSNNFVSKFLRGEPYSIIAGTRRGIVSNPKFVKMEYDYLLEDRENLEEMGINPIIVLKDNGPTIFANNTAYQRTLSAFNNLHVRDLLITIEDAIIDILQNYLFEFNTSVTRLEIKTIVETYLDTVRTSQGIYDYSVIMDEVNNTPEIIDNNFGIIDIAIEPTRGLQKFINRITVLKTGAISAGGFSVA